ncbi:DASH complex subunit Ask1-domain-containing protein [Pisolithus croceorrhizus]|nr:DASH complex subunit Ask1-domain-containing protein [Pisolithus croceorrhizus]
MTTPIPPNPPRWAPAEDPASIVVPGLDKSAPVNDQIDQIEQLITIKLENIDANFSKIQNILANRLLPAVKRYAVSTEPVREAAKFWTSFYEEAAQIHISTAEDHHANETQSQTSLTENFSSAYSDTESTPSPPGPSVQSPRSVSQGNHTYDVTASESSFMPANAISSTPARGTISHHWSSSLESPLVRLDRELQSFTREEEEEASARQDVTSVRDSFAYEEEDTIQQNMDNKGKNKELPTAIPRSILKNHSHNPQSAMPTPRLRATGTHVSPLKVKPKTPVVIPKHIQQYVAPETRPEPAIPSPRRPVYQRSPRKPQPQLPASSSTSSSILDIPSLTKLSSEAAGNKPFEDFNDSFDDSIDLMRGMSPPRTLAFARAPRTPMKEAADRIPAGFAWRCPRSTSLLLRSTATVERSQAYGYGSSVIKDDTMNTPVHALHTMMRRVGLDMPESSTRVSEPSGAATLSQHNSDAGLLAPPVAQHDIHTPEQQVSDSGPRSHTDSDTDSDSDSLGDEPARPSAAFLMASARNTDPDDSFASSSSNRSSDSLGAEEYGGEEVAGRETDLNEDSFDSVDGEGGIGGVVEEETVFGIPPAQRQQGRRSQGELRMLGEDLLQDTIGIGSQLSQTGRVEESPTPFGRN